MTKEIKQFKNKNDISLWYLFDEELEIPHYFNKKEYAEEYQKKHNIKGFIDVEGKN